MRFLRHQTFIAIIVVAATAACSQVYSIDRTRSKLLVHVFKSGLFSAFADNHEVEALIADGTVDEAAQRVNLVIDSRAMKVLDPQLTAEKRQQIQQRMLGPEVLDSERFPNITFESTKIEQIGQGQFLVRGQLSLRGVTRPISMNLQRENGRYAGGCTLKQSEFGIKPITIGGGSVKVKDEMKINFDIYTSAHAATTTSPFALGSSLSDVGKK
jgi:polyisoprenoid-binding protein YceI